MNDPSIHRFTFKSGAWLLTLALGAGAMAATPMPVKPFRIIDTTCDIDSSEVSPKGQLVCLYVCRDPDHSKVVVVYGNAGAAHCRTPIDKKIKQTIKTQP